jgi:hypothetical protein
MQTGGLSAGLVIATALLYKVFRMVNHHSIRGRCCGRTWDASIDIDSPLPSNGAAATQATAVPTSADTSSVTTETPIHIKRPRASSEPTTE